MKATLAALTLATCLAPAAADATVIDFTTYPSGSIDQSYGDVAGVLDVTYEYSLNGGPFVEGGIIWPGGYYGSDGENTNALIGPTEDYIMRITLTALWNTLTSVGVALSYWTGIDNYPLSVSGLRMEPHTLYV